MSDPRRPMPGSTELRRSVAAADATIPVISTTGLRPDADKQLGDEFVRCTAFGVDAFGWPVMTGCQRGVAQEDGGSEARPWPAGTPVFEVGWTAVDIVTEVPDPTRDMAGRRFAYQDPDGNIFEFRVVAYQDGTPYIDWIGTAPGDELGLTWKIAAAGLGNATGVAVDASGNVYVALPGELRKYDSGFELQWTQTFGSQLAHVATDGTHVYVADRLGFSSLVRKRICSTGAAGSPATIGTVGSGAGQLNGPYGIATNGTHVWVSEHLNSRVSKFTVGGSFVSSFGSQGSEDGEFEMPSGIALDGSGNIYVVDTENLRVQKFSSAHAHLLSFGGVGSDPGQFQFPDGIAIDSIGRIWVSDPSMHRLQVFSSVGAFLYEVGGFGAAPGHFKEPRQVAFSSSDRLYLADAGNDRLDTARAGIAGITPVVNERTAVSASIAAGANATTTATCDAGEVVVGGGYANNTTFSAGGPVASKRSGNGWQVTWDNEHTANVTITVFAYCMKVPLVEG